MPELPEVETTIRGLKSIVGSKIINIKINTPKLRYFIPKSILLINSVRITKIKRKGKFIIFYLQNKHSIVFHLGMSGRLRLYKKIEFKHKKHDHFLLKTNNGKILIFNDPRRFGSMHHVTEPSTHFLLEKLGPEPLSHEFNGEYLFQKIKKSLSPIKNALMDQKNVVGIGNIYANEILFDARIRPTRKSKTLKTKEYYEIAASTKKILKHAISAGGTTLQDFYKPDGNKGYFKIDLDVYDRANQKCRKCKEELIKRIVQSQRATFYCRKCQV